MSYRRDYGDELGSGIVVVGMIVFLIVAYVVVKAVVFVVRTFVKYHKRSLWIALGVCIASITLSVLLYKLTAFGGSFVLACVGIAVLLITCLVVDLKNRDTLLAEKTSLVQQIFTPWWVEDTPLEFEHDQVAA